MSFGTLERDFSALETSFGFLFIFYFLSLSLSFFFDMSTQEGRERFELVTFALLGVVPTD
jgi:hypothetical protein